MSEEQTKVEEVQEEEKFRLRSILSDEDATFLRGRSSDVAFVVADNSGGATIDSGTRELIQALKEYIIENDGLGMAAVQLGVLRRVFVMRKPWQTDNILVVINPKVTSAHGKSKKVEGCFSIPMPDNVGAYVERPSQINVEYYDERGEKHEDLFVGMDARVFLHELDHLNGKLMVDEPHFRAWRKLA